MFKFDASESISKKLILLVSLTAWAAIVLGLLVTTVNDIISTRQASETQINMLANVLARNSAPAILFNDAKAAKETLSAIDRNDIINRAEILNHNGQRQAIIFEACRMLGLKRYHYTKCDYNTGRIAIVMVPIIYDEAVFIETIKKIPLLESVKQSYKTMKSNSAK